MANRAVPPDAEELRNALSGIHFKYPVLGYLASKAASLGPGPQRSDWETPANAACSDWQRLLPMICENVRGFWTFVNNAFDSLDRLTPGNVTELDRCTAPGWPFRLRSTINELTSVWGITQPPIDEGWDDREVFNKFSMATTIAEHAPGNADCLRPFMRDLQALRMPAGGKPGAISSGRSASEKKPASANARMVDLLQKHGEEMCVKWSAQDWADQLGVVKSTIHATSVWKLMMRLRGESEDRQREKTTAKDDRGKRRPRDF